MLVSAIILYNTVGITTSALHLIGVAIKNYTN